jgi:acyl-coenzyme A synthetase/AMP-(fatty) acid ligase
MSGSARNFERDFVGAIDPSRIALIERSRSGDRRLWDFATLREHAGAYAGALAREGVGPGDVVMTLIGNRPEWVITLLACFRIGAVALPCSEQLTQRDLSVRLRRVPVAAIVADERNAPVIHETAPTCPVLWVSDPDLSRTPTAGHVDLRDTDPAVMIFTSGTSGEPKCAVHGQRYLWGQELQATAWVNAMPGEVSWCTAASGWSKSARNAFIAPWMTGATALLHDARFDVDERLAIVEEENVNVLCMAPTEYRALIKRSAPRPISSLRSTISAGEPLDAGVLSAWTETMGLDIRDGYGQTETGQLTAVGPNDEPRPGSMGKPLPGIKLWVEDGELVADPATIPTFFLGYYGERVAPGPWRTGDLAHADDDGFLYFEARTDNVIISAGYRIGPAEVEAVLLEHPAVAEAACVAYPDQERGSIVRAMIVLTPGVVAAEELSAEIQNHVRSVTAPYKYPRRIDFVESLPRTASGKIERAALRDL